MGQTSQTRHKQNKTDTEKVSNTSASAASALPALRLMIYTVAPALASDALMALPIPLLAPVTRAVWPLIRADEVIV